MLSFPHFCLDLLRIQSIEPRVLPERSSTAVVLIANETDLGDEKKNEGSPKGRGRGRLGRNDSIQISSGRGRGQGEKPKQIQKDV